MMFSYWLRCSRRVAWWQYQEVIASWRQWWRCQYQELPLFSTLDLILSIGQREQERLRRERRRRLHIWLSYLRKNLSFGFLRNGYSTMNRTICNVFYFYSFQIINFRPLRRWLLILRWMLKIRILTSLISQLGKRMKNLIMIWFNYNVYIFQFLISDSNGRGFTYNGL